MGTGSTFCTIIKIQHQQKENDTIKNKKKSNYDLVWNEKTKLRPRNKPLLFEGPFCEFNECMNPSVGNGLCEYHGGEKEEKNGKKTMGGSQRKRKRTRNTCIVKNCNKAQRKENRCLAHYKVQCENLCVAHCCKNQILRGDHCLRHLNADRKQGNDIKFAPMCNVPNCTKLGKRKYRNYGLICLSHFGILSKGKCIRPFCRHPPINNYLCRKDLKSIKIYGPRINDIKNFLKLKRGDSLEMKAEPSIKPEPLMISNVPEKKVDLKKCSADNCEEQSTLNNYCLYHNRTIVLNGCKKMLCSRESTPDSDFCWKHEGMKNNNNQNKKQRNATENNAIIQKKKKTQINRQVKQSTSVYQPNRFIVGENKDMKQILSQLPDVSYEDDIDIVEGFIIISRSNLK